MISYIVNTDEFIEELINELKKNFELRDSSSALGIPRLFGEVFHFEDGFNQTKKIIPSFSGVLKEIILKKKTNQKIKIKIEFNGIVNEFYLTDKELKIKNDGLDFIIKYEEITITVEIPKDEILWVEFIALTPKEGE